MMSDYIIFVRRSPIDGKYPIREGIVYTYDVSNHSSFFKFLVTEEQYNLVKNIGSDCLLLDLLKQDFPDSDFLNEELSDETKDIRSYGLDIAKYIENIVPLVINNP